jgi:5-methylcytosine-specific restriction endonuclease McrA
MMPRSFALLPLDKRGELLRTQMTTGSKTWQERRWRRARLHKLGLKMWEYENYLETQHWQALRKQKLEKQRGDLGHNCCEKCGERPQVTTREAALHLHHITYERLGEERFEDVMIVCRPCHDKEHGRNAESKQRQGLGG